MTNPELLQEYANTIRNLKKQSLDSGLTEEEFKNLYFEALNSVDNNEPTERNFIQRILCRFKYWLFLIIVFIFVVYNFKSAYSCIVCNMQEYIYPGLRLLRRLSIPIISLFPALTEFYHESCLIQNPFFTVVDMDCWPCSTVSNVQEIADPTPINPQYSAPFVYETEQPVINIGALKMLYQKNKHVFDKESPKIYTNNKYYLKPNDLFDQKLEDKNFYIWKFNTMNAAKILRQMIPRPKVVPKFGQSIERYIIVDTSHELFHVPDTECSYSFLLSLSGAREIHLEPAEECKHQCSTLKVELKETYLLWYNWWYWRPVVQQSMGNTTFIAHVGSYC